MIKTTSLLKRRRQGFTLVEVLISTALVSVVLALALTGFTEANKIADLTKSKVVASDEATLGVQKMAKIIRRCHIIFFDARPIPDHGTVVSTITPPNGANGTGNTFATAGHDATFGFANATLLAKLGAIPTTLLNEPDNGVVQQRWVPGAGKFPNGTNAADVSRNQFRFMTGANVAARAPLQTNDPDATAPEDQFFSSPLFYGAQATFNTGNRSDGSQPDASFPLTWTFYVFYLAPMSFDATRDVGHALFPARGAADGGPQGLNGQRDMGRGLGGTAYTRTTMPYEIRLLTIPDVLAIKYSESKASSNSATRYFGRQLRGANDGIKNFPHDVAKDGVNYDPLPLAIDQVETLVKVIPAYTPADGSSARVNGSEHGNFSNIGNDPPNEAALDPNDANLSANGQRRHWLGVAVDNSTVPPTFDATNAWGPPDPITDTLVASYVDPDAPNGTFVRLAVDDAWRGINHRQRAYVSAYGGPQRLRDFQLQDPIPNSGIRKADLSVPPKRAMLSVSTRYRSSTAIPFSFGTEAIEVDLEALARYQSTDRMSN